MRIIPFDRSSEKLAQPANVPADLKVEPFFGVEPNNQFEPNLVGYQLATCAGREATAKKVLFTN